LDAEPAGGVRHLLRAAADLGVIRPMDRTFDAARYDSVRPWNLAAWSISDEIINGLSCISPNMTFLTEEVTYPR
jgi:hypothetical protein